MTSKTSQAVSVSALIISSILVGLSIAAICLASHAHGLLAKFFPAGFYGWSMSHFIGEKGFNVQLAYNRSSEIKTFVSAALALLAGLFGTFAFGLTFKRPAHPLLSRYLLASAAVASIVTIVCVSWAAIAEVQIKRSTCWFDDGATPDQKYTCSIENAACNALRFTDEAWSGNDRDEKEKKLRSLDTSCLELRHSRYIMIPLAVFSLLLTIVYASQVWMRKDKETEDERADTRVRGLQQEE